ncbi:MAG: response regulator, partial [Planctomycetes bacterium]|nr:response regulator [Planctomycetota bacterium]
EVYSTLLFHCGSAERFAVLLPMINHIEKIQTKDIEQVSDKEYINIKGDSVLVVRINEILSIQPEEDLEQMYLILPKHTSRNFGLLASRLEDIVQVSSNIDSDSISEDGLLGSCILDEQMVLFVDMHRIIDIVSPGSSALPEKVEEVRGKIKILHAEDTLIFRQIVRGYLESDGYEVVSANDGQEAYEMFQEDKYDLLLSDMEMPEMDGFGLIRAIRSGSFNNQVPAIALTTLARPEDREKGLRLGFDRYELKIDRSALLATVSDVLKTKQQGTAS